jgi:hypothetical protein
MALAGARQRAVDPRSHRDRPRLPRGGVEIDTDERRPAEFDAVGDGSTAENGLDGEGIVNAVAAVARRH